MGPTGTNGRGNSGNSEIFLEQEEIPVVGGRPQVESNQQFEPRRSGRERQEKPACTLPCCMLLKRYDEDIIIPITLAEALDSSQRSEWITAMKEEIGILKDMKTWEHVEKTEDMNIVGCKWVYSVKRNHVGLIVKFKARLVARGFSQIAGLDFEETYSPVMRRRCLRILIALAVQNEWEIQQVDIISAYLNSPIDVPVYMQQPPYFEEENSKTHVCRLLRSLYVFKQSGRNWNNFLHQCLVNMGMQQSELDLCIYYHTDIIVGIHVDDMLVVGRSEVITIFKQYLQGRMKMKDLGEASLILSVRVTRNDGVIIDQSRYVEEILKELQQQDCYPHAAPLPLQAMERELPNEFNRFEIDGIYRKATGSLQYLAGGTRPDIAFSISRLSQYNENPTNQDWSNILHLLGYLKMTKEYGIHYKKNEEGIEVFVDADWGNDSSDARSVTGYVVKLAGGAISWHSKKQTLPDCCTKVREPVVACSSTHSEYFALYEVVVEVEWLKLLLTELGQEKYVASPIVIFADNIAAIKLAQKEGHSERTRNINVKYHYTRQLVKKGLIELKHVKSVNNLADLFTKILTGVKTKNFAAALGLY